MNKWILLISLSCLLLAILVVVINHRRTKRTMVAIADMLDKAISGTYTETTFDESCLSALEIKFAQYLSSSAISTRNVTLEKDKIKTLIADISHQTKTPIANLLLYSDMLAEKELPEDMRTDVTAIQQQTEKLRFLIDALVKLSRLENGILTLTPHPGPLQPMLQEIQAQYASKAAAKGLALRVIDTTAQANFDPKWTAEALANLVDNATKYTSSGSVTITATEYDLFTRIDVKDTGIGVRASEQAKIFSRFYRSEAVRDDEGVGIGLYLTRKIISGQGGYLKLTSSPGKGSTFSVFLPREAEILQNC